MSEDVRTVGIVQSDTTATRTAVSWPEVVVITKTKCERPTSETYARSLLPHRPAWNAPLGHIYRTADPGSVRKLLETHAQFSVLLTTYRFTY